jgi:hypothetical protein
MMSDESLNTALVKAKICKPEDIAGCSEEGIASLECLAGIKFPSQYRWFLSEAGKAAGDFFKGTDIYVPALKCLNSEATSLIYENKENFVLPSDAFVFSMHQGYEFCFFVPPMEKILLFISMLKGVGRLVSFGVPLVNSYMMR